jgi:hypothetical protein
MWFNDMGERQETAIYLEHFHNYGMTCAELLAGGPSLVSRNRAVI